MQILGVSLGQRESPDGSARRRMPGNSCRFVGAGFVGAGFVGAGFVGAGFVGDLLARAQIFIFDVIIAVSAFIVMALVITGLSRPAEFPERQEAYSLCVSALEALKGNSTIQLAANGTTPESALNSSLSLLPSRYGYRLDVAAYSLNGSPASLYSGQSGNLAEALLYKDVISAQSSFVTANATPLLGKAQMRCWVR